MEAVRPKSKGKAKKKTKSSEAKARDKTTQSPSTGASMSSATTPVATATEQESTQPLVVGNVPEEPETADSAKGDTKTLLEESSNELLTKSPPLEVATSDVKVETTKGETQVRAPEVQAGLSGSATGGERELSEAVTVSGGVVELPPILREEGVELPPILREEGVELPPSLREEEEPVRSKLLKQEVPVLEVAGVSQPEQVEAPLIRSKQVSRENEVVTQLERDSKIDSLVETESESRTAFGGQIADTHTHTNQATAPSAPVLTETQMVTMDTVAMETTGLIYPDLDSLAAEQELTENLVPFTEEDLSLLYPNRQLETREVFEDVFIQESRQDNHPLYELLSIYLKSRQALVASQAHLQALENDYDTYKPLIWKTESQTITSSARCGDRVKLSHDHTYKMAVFNPEAALHFNTALTETRNVLQEELSMTSYSSQLARIHVEHYLSQLLKLLPVLSQLHQDVGFTSWIPQSPPGTLDRHSSHIRDAISVLFTFERRPNRDEQFTSDCRQWLNMLMSVLLRIATLTDHQFIQHHLLRCPPGVSEWGVAYLQVMSPLRTGQVLEAQFGQRDILTGSIPDHHYAYDWGVGMGLHQDWGGPFLDYFVCALATLLLPIKQREEFLVALNVPIATRSEGERHRWTFVEEDLEEVDEENMILLKESDFISFLDQFPFTDLFQHILQIGVDGELPVAKTTSHQMLRLIAFSTCLIRLLGAAFSTLRLSRYKEFVKQVGRTIRQTVQYVADQWSVYRAYRLSNGDTMSSVPQQSVEGDGQARYSLNRLQLEFDQFVLRATQWILTAHRLGAWQFLADMPYDTISLTALWNIFYCIYSNQIRASDSTSGETGEGGGVIMTNSSPSQAEEVIAFLEDPTHKAQFTDLLMKTFTSEAVFLLTTFANMARARVATSDEERQFITTIVLEIFEVTQVMDFSSDVYSRTGSSLLDSIAIVHPFIISVLIGRISEVVSHVGENCISVMRELPLHIWTPTSADLGHAHQWLVGTPLQSDTNKLARVMIGELNWGRRTEDGSNTLVLDWWTHRSVALMVVEAHSVLLPWHPGGKDYTSVQSSIGKYKSTLQRLTMSQEEKDFVSWSWEVLLMLKLHPNQVIRTSMEVLTPESSAPTERTGPPAPAKDTSVYRRRAEPDWARLSPDSDAIILPDLTSSNERELAELRDAVLYEGILAAYVALCITSLGSDTDHFLLGGLPLLNRLINEGYFLPALRVIANLTPRFFQHKKILIENMSFLQAIIAVANADSASVSLRDRISFVTPQPMLLRKMAGLVHTQLQSGCGQRGGVSSDVILQFWTHVLLSYPSWHREQSLLYLLNSLCLAAFNQPTQQKLLINALLEAYRGMNPFYVRRGILSPVWSVVVGGGPPSIFTSVSIKEFPWLAYFSLCAEQQFEEKEGIWKELLLQLKKDPKISIDNALKKAFTELKTAPGAFNSSNLSIYRWAEFCSNLEPGHPLMPLVWQKFFSLYLQRPVLESTMPERGSLGLRFFSNSKANSQRRQMKSALSAICMKLQSQIDKLRRGEEGEGEGEGEREDLREYLPKTLSLFQTLNLWLEEPRLHDPSLYLPGLPQQYDSQRLSTIFSSTTVELWTEFVPLWEVKGQRMSLVEEWLQVESYQKTLPSHTPKTASDDAITRIQKRLKRRKEPVAPPTLQGGPTPFEHLTEEILLSPDSLLLILRSDIQFIVQQASTYSTKYNTLATLDTQYMDAIPELYSNVPRQHHVSVPCKSRIRSSHRCSNPATIVFRFDEMQINPKWEQHLAVNRSEYSELIASLSLPLSGDLCKAVMRMEHTVGELSRLSQQLPDTERSLSVQSGVALFYEILTNMSEDCRQFPPSCQFFTTCIRVLGQEFIQQDTTQTVRILECLLEQPNKADLLSPLFHPNSCPERFLDMYSDVEAVVRKEGPNLALAVLTKFDVLQWLKDYPSSLPDRTNLLLHVWRGVCLCGATPSLELQIILESYKQHLKCVVEYHFPELLHNFLQLLVEATDSSTVAPSIWETVTNILTLNKAHPEDCRLGLQQCQDVTAFLSHHYMRKRTVSRETLYSLISWDYIPPVGNFLYLLCCALVCRWEESVSMGTTTYQNGMIVDEF